MLVKQISSYFDENEHYLEDMYERDDGAELLSELVYEQMLTS